MVAGRPRTAYHLGKNEVKCRNLQLKKGKVQDGFKFKVEEQVVTEKPVKSLESNSQQIWMITKVSEI